MMKTELEILQQELSTLTQAQLQAVLVFVRFLKLSEEEQTLLQQNKLREFKGKLEWDGSLEELRTARTLPPKT